MTEKQFRKCLTCLNRKKGIYDKNNICNLRNKDLDFSDECFDYLFDKKAKTRTQKQNVFKVYEPLKKPFFTLNSIFYIISLLVILLSILIKYYKISELKSLWKVSGILLVLFILISSFYNLNKIEKLNAKYLGELIIYKDQIQILNVIYKLTEIEKINFFNNDYIGAHKDLFEEVDLSPSLSNGIDNRIILELKNGKIKIYKFIQETRDDLLRNREILIHYYLNGKLNFSDIKRILHLYQKKDIRKLEIELKNKKTLYNNQYNQ